MSRKLSSTFFVLALEKKPNTDLNMKCTNWTILEYEQESGTRQFYDRSKARFLAL